MTPRSRTLKLLAALLSASALGASVTLASTKAEAITVPDQQDIAQGVDVRPSESVADRLQAIRIGVSEVIDGSATPHASDPDIAKAWWGNGGWGRWRGGWGNGGGWRNGGWGNGGWRNGGWGNGGWGNGWHNGWRNW